MLLRLKQSCLIFFKHDYDSYLTFTDHEGRCMLWNSYASCAHPKYYFKNQTKIGECFTSSGSNV